MKQSCDDFFLGDESLLDPDETEDVEVEEEERFRSPFFPLPLPFARPGLFDLSEFMLCDRDEGSCANGHELQLQHPSEVLKNRQGRSLFPSPFDFPFPLDFSPFPVWADAAWLDLLGDPVALVIDSLRLRELISSR